MSARSPETLGHAQLFDEGCTSSRLKELTQGFIGQYVKEDLKAWALEHKKAFSEIPLYPLNEEEIQNKFYEKARGEALKILEEERKNYVDYLTSYIRTTLQSLIRRLRPLVYGIDEKGKSCKLKIIIERKIVRDDERRTFEERDVQYVGDNETERYNQIVLLQSRLNEFPDYVPYMSQELRELYSEASNLANLEVVRKDAKTQEA
jgi:hypothetical protein